MNIFQEAMLGVRLAGLGNGLRAVLYAWKRDRLESFLLRTEMTIYLNTSMHGETA